MNIETLLVAATTLFASWVLTAFVRRLALRRGLMDVPNARSSHATPTPRGGGIAIYVCTAGGATVLYLLGLAEGKWVLALAAGGGLVAGIGLIDDYRPLPAKVRLAVHLGAGFFTMVIMGGMPDIRIGADLYSFGPAGYLLGTVIIAWSINLFNFMDGIDGIAASESTFVLIVAICVSVIVGTFAPLAALYVVAAAAILGFLFWNWSPARIFMGDVGSGFLGYLIATLALASATLDAAGLYVWMIASGLFFADTTVTLVRRIARGERIYVAHRMHAYQWMSRRLASHAQVTTGVLLVNVVLLLPCSLLAAVIPVSAHLTMVSVLSLLFVLVWMCGAGRPESVPAAPTSETHSR